MKLSVLIPSFQRAADLQRCLAALTVQDRPADAVIVIARADDHATLDILPPWQSRLPLAVLQVGAPGVVHAINTGLAQCDGDLVAMTDDDAAPRPDWLARIETCFRADAGLGGVGGRDRLHRNGRVEAASRQVVGRISWFGRYAGNHHRGAGPAREVDVLKGVNCAFRRCAIAPIGFDRRLRGAGAQAHWEIGACLALQAAGWRLRYDPRIVVDHFPAQRAVGNRAGRTLADAYDLTFNYALGLRRITGRQKRLAAQCWLAGVGTRAQPGWFWAARLVARHGAHGYRLWRRAVAGRAAARQAGPP